MLRLTGIDIQRCPACQQGRLRVIAVLAPDANLPTDSQGNGATPMSTVHDSRDEWPSDRSPPAVVARQLVRASPEPSRGARRLSSEPGQRAIFPCISAAIVGS